MARLGGLRVRVITTPPYYPDRKFPPEHRGWRYRRKRRIGARVYRAALGAAVAEHGQQAPRASFQLCGVLVLSLDGAEHCLATEGALVRRPGLGMCAVCRTLCPL